MACALAAKLGVACQLVPYANPGLLADAASNDEWDVGLIGSEPARAETIAFSAPYAEIEATFLVPAGSTLNSIDEVDADGVTVAVSARAAYDLWLTANLKRAVLHRTAAPGLPASRELFLSGGMDALAGLRPWLLDQAGTIPGCKVLDGRFTTVQQAIGLPRHKDDGGASLFIERFVQEAKASGLVAELLERHGVGGKLSVAS